MVPSSHSPSLWVSGESGHQVRVQNCLLRVGQSAEMKTGGRQGSRGTPFQDVSFNQTPLSLPTIPRKAITLRANRGSIYCPVQWSESGVRDWSYCLGTKPSAPESLQEVGGESTLCANPDHDLKNAAVVWPSLLCSVPQVRLA